MKVLVTHPGRQHSHQAALALAAAGMLAGYWSGVPALERQRRGIPGPLWRRFVRYAPVALAAEQVRWAPWVPALRRTSEALVPARLAARADFLACRLFDRWAAAGLRRLARSAPEAPQVVMACEISARETFRAARRLGLATLLDAAALHHRTQDRLHGFAEAPDLHRRITAVKDEEIALADAVLTTSELARQSYVEAGVPAEKVHCLPLGADVALFAPPPEGRGRAADTGFAFVFAGPASRVKGFDLLLAAFARVRASEPAACLWAIGPAGELTRAPLPEGASRLGSLPQRELAARFHQADCLVLPSRGESFGMVVPEALAAGLPVVASDRVGAAELLEPGETGFRVPAGEVEALAGRMLWCARHPADLERMRPACREAAARADWSIYRARLPVLLRRILGAGEPASEAAVPIEAATAGAPR